MFEVGNLGSRKMELVNKASILGCIFFPRDGIVPGEVGHLESCCVGGQNPVTSEHKGIRDGLLINWCKVFG